MPRPDHGRRDRAFQRERRGLDRPARSSFLEAAASASRRASVRVRGSFGELGKREQQHGAVSAARRTPGTRRMAGRVRGAVLRHHERLQLGPISGLQQELRGGPKEAARTEPSACQCRSRRSPGGPRRAAAEHFGLLRMFGQQPHKQL